MAESRSATSDTVILIETLRDTVVRIDADSAMIRALIECDSLGQAHLKQLLDYKVGDRLKPPMVTLKDNILTAKAEIDSMTLYLTLKDRYEKNVRDRFRQETKIVEVNRLNRWQNFWIRFGQIAALIMTAILGVKIIKIIK